MFDSFFLSLLFHQETYPGLQEQDPQVYKECFTSLKHPESEKKRLRQHCSLNPLGISACFRICSVLVGHVECDPF